MKNENTICQGVKRRNNLLKYVTTWVHFMDVNDDDHDHFNCTVIVTDTLPPLRLNSSVAMFTRENFGCGVRTLTQSRV